MIRNSLLAQGPVSSGPPPPSRSASAAATQPRQLYSEYEAIDLTHNLSPPTLSQLSSLLALPSALYQRGKRSGQSGSRKGRGRLAKEGQIISKCFNAFGTRPYPVNGVSLEQTITMEMQYTVQSFITSSTTSGLPTFAALDVSLNAFSGASSLLLVFDQYKFEQLEAWIEFSAPNQAQAYPVLMSAVDLDDSAVPTAIGQVQDHQGALVTDGPGGHYHKWLPHVAVAAYSGAFTSYSNMPATWIDAASPNVQHYGLKACMLSNGITAVTASIVIRGVISFRAPVIN